MAKQMCVFRLERVAGDGGGLGTEIKREYSDGRIYSPSNVAKERSSRNRQVVGSGDPTLHGGNYIADAIRRRIEGAALGRKVGTNQCRAMVAYLSGTHEQMMQLAEEGKLDAWVDANVEWLQRTFGAANVVAVDLHLDEYTPHLHAVIVPITDAPRARRSREGSAKYNTSPSANRLCADEFLKKSRLKQYQDTYAAAMARFGLERGVRGSEARHQSMNEYYRSLKEERIPEAERTLEETQKVIEGKKVISAKLDDEHKRKRKKIDTEKGSRIRRGLANLVGKSVDEVVSERDATIADLKAQLAELRHERRDLKKQAATSDAAAQELQGRIDELNATIKSLSSELKRLQSVVATEPQRNAAAIAQARSEGKTEGRAEGAAAAQEWQRKYTSLEREVERKVNLATLKLREENTDFKALNKENDAFILAVGKFLYEGWSDFKNAVNSINDFIDECFEGDAQSYRREELKPHEAARLKQVGKQFDYSYFFARCIAETGQVVFGWSDAQTRRAAAEINAVFEGRYDRVLSFHL